MVQWVRTIRSRFVCCEGPGEQEVSGLDVVRSALDVPQGIDLCDSANAGEVVGPGQGRVDDDRGRALLAPPMVGLDFGSEDIGLADPGEAALDSGEEPALVLLEGEDVLALGVEDRLGHGAMAVQGVDGDDAALEREQLDRFQCTGHLVAAGGQALGQGQTLLGRPDIDQMQGGRLGALGKGALDRLAVDRHHTLEPVAPGECPHEAGEGGLESVRVEQAEHPAEGIVARNAVLQSQDLPQHVFLGCAEIGHVRAALRPAQHRSQRNEQKLQQIVPRVPGPRILDIFENRNETTHRSLQIPERPSESKSFPAAIPASSAG